MAHTSSSRAKVNVAILGCTGRLGTPLTETFLSETWRPFFSRVVCLTRDTSSSKAREFASLGGEIVSVDPKAGVDGFTRAFRGVDVVINVLDSTVNTQMKLDLVQGMVQAGVTVYFPSEFGTDHRLNDFPAFDHPAWDAKREHVKYVNEVSGGNIKVISVFTGLFVELSFVPLFGIDVPGRQITSVGPSNVKIAYSTLHDIARSLAQLCILSIQSSYQSLPDYVRIYSALCSAEDTQKVLQDHFVQKGDANPQFEVKIVDLEKYKTELKEEMERGTIPPPLKHLRVLMGEGKFDYSGDNHRDLVNLNQSVWKWDTLEAYVFQKYIKPVFTEEEKTCIL